MNCHVISSSCNNDKKIKINLFCLALIVKDAAKNLCKTCILFHVQENFDLLKKYF